MSRINIQSSRGKVDLRPIGTGRKGDQGDQGDVGPSGGPVPDMTGQPAGMTVESLGAGAARWVYPRVVPVVAGDIAGAVAKIAALGHRQVLHVSADQSINVTSTIALPDSVAGVIVDGELVGTADVPIFTRAGSSPTSAVTITVNVAAGDREVTVNPATFAVGDWVFVLSNDVLPGSTDKLGYLRRVRGLTGTKADFDVPLPRAMTTANNVRMRKVTLAAPIFFGGYGTIRYDNPVAYFSNMIEVTLGRNVVVHPTLALRDGGMNAIRLNHVVGYDLDLNIDNFLDDNIYAGHFGYGVNLSGSCRDGAVIRGHVSRCRHAVTTNVGPNFASFPYYGEPENVVVDLTTSHCTDKAIDSHRAGYGFTARLNDQGSGGTCQIRCDGAHVEGQSQGSRAGAVVAVGANLVTVPTIGPLRAINHGADIIVANSNVRLLSMPQVIGGTGQMFSLGAGVTATVDETQTKLTTATVSAISQDASYVALPDLDVTLRARGTYLIRYALRVQGTQAGDMQLGFTSVPSGATVYWTPNGASSGATSPGASINRVSISQTAASVAAASGGGTNSPVVGTAGATTATEVLIEARVVMGSTGGTLSLGFAQNVSDATASSVLAGSAVEAVLRKVAA